MTKQAELAVRESALVVRQPGRLAQALLSGEPVAAMDDPEQVMRAIVLRILSSETSEEALAASKLTGWRAELLGVPVALHGVEPRNSDVKEGAFYAIADVTRLDTGERLLVQTGGEKVLALLAVMDSEGNFPYNIRLVEQGEGREGRNPVLGLEAA